MIANLSDTSLGVIGFLAISLIISLLTGSAIAWNTSRRILFFATIWLQKNVQLFGCAYFSVSKNQERGMQQVEKLLAKQIANFFINPTGY